MLGDRMGYLDPTTAQSPVKIMRPTQPTRVDRSADLSTEHYAVLVDNSFRYDDGYGERGQTSYSTCEHLNYLKFENLESVKAWILTNRDKKFTVALVKPLKFTEQIIIDIESST